MIVPRQQCRGGPLRCVTEADLGTQVFRHFPFSSSSPISGRYYRPCGARALAGLIFSDNTCSGMRAWRDGEVAQREVFHSSASFGAGISITRAISRIVRHARFGKVGQSAVAVLVAQVEKQSEPLRLRKKRDSLQRRVRV